MVRISLSILIAFMLAATPATASSIIITFRTPSGNIGCFFTSGIGPGPAIRCDIRSGLRPKPPRPRKCELDWGDSYELGATGRAGVTCHGDTAIDPRARVLRYGSTWRRGAFTCKSSVTGLRCRNRSSHGFFMSRQHSYRF